MRRFESCHPSQFSFKASIGDTWLQSRVDYLSAARRLKETFVCRFLC
jgi:hypothetical protein